MYLNCDLKNMYIPYECPTSRINGKFVIKKVLNNIYGRCMYVR